MCNANFRERIIFVQNQRKKSSGQKVGRILILRLVFLISCCILSPKLFSQIVISDGTYDPANWNITSESDFGGSHTCEQLLSGGNPGAFRRMQHILPVPPTDTDVTRIEVAHIYIGGSFNPQIDGAIDRIDFSEDIILLTLPYADAFIECYAAVQQGARIFKSTGYVRVVGVTTWQTRTFSGLTAQHFVAIDGSGDHPDFSESGGVITFGFIRLSTRMTTMPPIPPEQSLIYEHGSDNFSVTIYIASDENRPPIAVNDTIIYNRYDFRDEPDPDYYAKVRVLKNDTDPDGDPIKITNVTIPVNGGDIWYDASSIFYRHLDFIEDKHTKSYDQFYYTISDNLHSSEARVIVYLGDCLIEWIALPTKKTVGKTIASLKAIISGSDSLDIELYRRVRDEVLLTTEDGKGFVDFYYENSLELLPVIVFNDPKLLNQAIYMTLQLQEPLRDLIDGDGDEIITQSLIDTANVFFDSLLTKVSDSLRNDLNFQLNKLGPLDAYAGISIDSAVTKSIGEWDLSHVKNNSVLDIKGYILEQNYPNPFNPETTIRYQLPIDGKVILVIYNMMGQVVKWLVDDRKKAGYYEEIWDGRDRFGNVQGTGMYLVRMQAGSFTQTRKLLLLK